MLSERTNPIGRVLVKYWALGDGAGRVDPGGECDHPFRLSRYLLDRINLVVVALEDDEARICSTRIHPKREDLPTLVFTAPQPVRMDSDIPSEFNRDLVHPLSVHTSDSMGQSAIELQVTK